jgi:hypothetical protein
MVGAAAVGLALAFTGGASADVTNPYYPLRPGMRWEYRGTNDGRPVKDVIKVSGRVEIIDGVPCAVVSDRLYLDGSLHERTTDWYSQDAQGNVRYYGEATAQLDSKGNVASTEGSWRAGTDGARAGIFMPADPKAGQTFQQEHYRGHAEDHFRVIDLRATITVPFGTYRRRALMTQEWTPLEPGVRDGKWYARGVGQVAERSLKGGSEFLELVSFTRR